MKIKATIKSESRNFVPHPSSTSETELVIESVGQMEEHIVEITLGNSETYTFNARTIMTALKACTL